MRQHRDVPRLFVVVGLGEKFDGVGAGEGDVAADGGVGGEVGLGGAEGDGGAVLGGFVGV